MTRLALLALALLAVLASPALGQPPQASLVDLEDEVMCPVCGTLLELARAPQAERQRALISRLIASGLDKQQIKDELVVEYGSEVLAEPEGRGFQLTAYLVPALAFLIAAIALAIGVWRWRGPRGPGDSGPPPGGGPSDEQAARLEADIARYDL